MATVLESSKLSPSAGCSPSEPSLPLVFFDMFWYDCPAARIVMMLDIPCLTKVHFLNDIVPRLKKSLSLTLNHFFPLAGNIIHPLTPIPLQMPVLRYEATDSVPFTVCESTADFTHLTGNHPRSCDEFHALAPLLPGATRSHSSISCPVLALQVTLFPGKGISIGFVIHHVVADASTVVSFIRSWALFSRIGPDAAAADPLTLTEANLSPFLDRKTVTNINGLDSAYWDEIVKFSFSVEPPPVESPINKLRATFVLKREEIEKLKHLVRAKSPSVAHVSSFTVVCALVWACSAKSAGEHVAEDEPEYFTFTVDCRGRLKPTLPATYFGNCVAVMKAELMHGQVKGADGFMMAVAAIGAELNSARKGSILDGAEKWPEDCGELAGKRCYGVSGSPRFDFYAADFGWGKPKKIEVVSIDDGAAMSLWASRDFEGGVEIGLSKPALQMEAFATVFNHTLAHLLHHGSLFPIPLFSRY